MFSQGKFLIVLSRVSGKYYRCSSISHVAIMLCLIWSKTKGSDFILFKFSSILCIWVFHSASANKIDLSCLRSRHENLAGSDFSIFHDPPKKVCVNKNFCKTFLSTKIYPSGEIINTYIACRIFLVKCRCGKDIASDTFPGITH